MSSENPYDPRWPAHGVGSRPPADVAPDPALKRWFGSLAFVLDAARRRRGGRMVLWGLVVALAVSGSGLIAYPFATDIWAGRIQDTLGTQLDKVDTSRGQVAFHQSRKDGDAITRLSIPKLGIKNLIVVEGISGNALRAGAGHYPNTALPGDPTGNVAIAGHRTGFGQPFRHLERLTEGDQIVLNSPFGRYVYEVMPAFDGHKNPWVTDARDWTVVDPRTPEPSLTLTTCDPPGTSENRLIVRARLASSSSKT